MALVAVAFAGCRTPARRGGIYDEVTAALHRSSSPTEASAAFDAALRARGMDPSRYELVVHVDEVVRPMCFVRGADGRSWTLAEFDAAQSR